MIARALVVSAVVLALVAPVRADDSEKDRKQRALVLLKEGRSRYDLGRFDEALVLFEQSYEVWPYPEALYNLAQAWRMKGDLKKAVFYYRAYLRNKPDAANRQEVEERIEELEKLIAEQEASKDKPPEGTSEPEVKPGEGQPAEVKPALQQPPRLPVVADPWYADGWGWGVGGVGVVAVGVGAWALYDAGQLDDQAALADQLEAPALFERARDRRLLGYVVGGAGVALVTAGVIMLYRTDASEPERDPLSVSGWFDGDGAGVAASGWW